jgi:hypothetical protein
MFTHHVLDAMVGCRGASLIAVYQLDLRFPVRGGSVDSRFMRDAVSVQ